MQVLYVKGPDGKSTVPVTVIRSFQEIAGQHIFQHLNGTYGDSAGVPVRTEAELQNLPPAHRKAALAWWKRTGEAQSKAYYADKAAQEEKLAGDFQESLAAQENNSTLDAVLYSRRAITDGKKTSAISAAKSWMEFGFTSRPDWWGQAQTLSFKDFAYQMQDMEKSAEPAPDPAPLS